MLVVLRFIVCSMQYSFLLLVNIVNSTLLFFFMYFAVCLLSAALFSFMHCRCRILHTPALILYCLPLCVSHSELSCRFNSYRSRPCVVITVVTHLFSRHSFVRLIRLVRPITFRHSPLIGRHVFIDTNKVAAMFLE